MSNLGRDTGYFQVRYYAGRPWWKPKYHVKITMPEPGTLANRVRVVDMWVYTKAGADRLIRKTARENAYSVLPVTWRT